jgi:UDP-glucose 4-epimerase
VALSSEIFCASCSDLQLKVAMRIIVTGGAGFIGSHLTDTLLGRGDEVWVVDDLSAGRASCLHQAAVLFDHSIMHAKELAGLVEDVRPELICHLAAQIDVRASVEFPADDARVNVVGTINVLEAARRANTRVLFCSSGGALYGQDAPIPSPESVSPMPESPYGNAKYCAEQYISLYNRLHGTCHAVLRLANVYGPRQCQSGEAAVIPRFCSRALRGERLIIYGDGRQTRDFVYVSDVVEAFLAAADCRIPGTWNIGTGTEVSVLDLAGLISEIAGRPFDPEFAPSRAGELERSAVSAELARRVLGWCPVTTLADGVRAVYRWIENGAHDRESHLATDTVRELSTR